ncbi:MAG: diguanylate cyclase [Desulfobacula sp.]|jgi:diguanylate cyclase (GGDEF)-like protein/PAS domain S-box-containing protein
MDDEKKNTGNGAESISNPIEYQRLQAALKQSHEIAEVLREITRAIHNSENLNHLFETIHQTLSRVINVSNFYIGLYEKKTNSISFPFYRDEYDTVEIWDVSYLKTNSLTNEVFQKQKPILLNKQDLDIRAEQKQVIGTIPVIWLGIPLMTKTEPIGVMVIQSYSDPEAFDQKDVDFLCAVSEQIAVAVARKRAENALKESEARFRALIDHSHDAVLIHEPDGRIIDVNNTMLKMFDVTYAEALTYTLEDYTGPESSIVDSQSNWMRALAGEDVLFPWQARRPKDGSLFDVEIYLTLIISGKRKLILFNIRDITEQKKAEKALRASEEKYRLLFENSVEGIFQTTPAGRFLSVNPSFYRIFGFSSQEELFEHFKNIGTQQYVNPEDRENFKRIVETEGVVNAFETQLLKKDGTPIWVSLNARAVKDDEGMPLYYEGFLQDITERKTVQEELYRISIHDHLTGICNRRYVFERLDAMVNEFRRETRHFSLSIIDLDHFKKINDTHGHQAGDFILREFASILSDCFRPYDLVGRYGGEEFVVVAMNIDILQTRNMLERIREVVKSRVFDFNGTLIRIAFSAGVANTGETGQEMTVENLIQKADERLYLAKNQGRDRIITE